MEEKEILFNLTIRSTVKTVNDMTFKCPNYWNVANLKQFINTYHKSAVHIYKLESWSLMFLGKVLKEDEILSEIIKRKITNDTPIFFIYLHPAATLTNEKLKIEFENNIKKETQDLKKQYYESSLLNDYNEKLKLNTNENPGPNSNTPNLGLISILPIFNNYFNDGFKEVKAKKDSEKKPSFKSNFDERIHSNIELVEEDKHFQTKIFIKISCFLVFFTIYMKGSIYTHLFFVIMFIYWRIAIQINLRKLKNKRKANLEELFKKINSLKEDYDKIDKNSDNKSINLLTDKIKEKENKQKNSKNEIKKISSVKKIYYLFYEIIICFVYSFYPTWYIELYSEDQIENEEYMQIVESIRKDWFKIIPPIITKIENENKEEIKVEKKDEEKKEEEDLFDPTDNINPENFKLIQKLHQIHQKQIFIEKLKKNQNDKDDNNENRSEKSMNSEPTKEGYYRKIDAENNDIIETKSLEDFEKDYSEEEYKK